MATEDTTPHHLRKLAAWLDSPLTPGREKELSDWLSTNPNHQIQWERWLRFNADAKQLQVVSSDVLEEWAILRDELHLGRSTKKKSRSITRKKRSSFFKRPLVVAVMSMAAYSAFLLILHLIKSGSAF